MTILEKPGMDLKILEKIKKILEQIEQKKLTGRTLIELNCNQGKVSRIYQVNEKRIELN